MNDIFLKNSKKGLSVFVSHVIAIAILFVVLIVISFQMYSYYYSIKGATQKSVSTLISREISNLILGLYTTYKNSMFTPSLGENETLAEIYMNIPEKIGGNSYEISLVQHGDFWIDANVAGSSSLSTTERPYTSVRIKIMGKPSSIYTYPVYNVVPLIVSGSSKKSTRIKLSYIRENKDGLIRDYIIMERAS